MKLKLFLTLFCVLFLTNPAKAAGGTGDPTNSGNPNSNTSSGILSGTSPISNPFQNSFSNSYSSSYSGYGGNCGVQVYINGGVLGGNSPNSISLNGVTAIEQTTSSAYGVQAGLVFNSKKCTNEERLEQNRSKTQITQTSIQVCGPERVRLADKDPTITKARLDEICPIMIFDGKVK